MTHQYGVTNLQYLLLLHVKGYKGREWATIGELAERLQSHHHGIVSLASRCEKLGLIYRQRGVVDKREVEIHLTPEGGDQDSRPASPGVAGYAACVQGSRDTETKTGLMGCGEKSSTRSDV